LAYHQPAIRRIVQGFNPIYDGYMNLGRAPDTWSAQATYFPKATWYFAAALTAALGDIQLGTAYQLLVLFAALLFVFAATKGESVSRRFLWIAACLNPIALTQIVGYLVDGVLGTLSFVGIFYAYLFFSGKAISRREHFFCLLSLAMLFCVKTTGFVYGSIVLFFIGLQRLASYRLSLKLGIPVFLLVFVWGFAPYVTNLLHQRHIFYPLMETSAAMTPDDAAANVGGVGRGLDTIAQAIYPNAHNRFTRLLYSIMSHTQEHIESPVKIKNPFDVSLTNWRAFSGASAMRAAGLGPLFFLLLLVSILCLPVFCFSRGEVWLLSMLLVMLFIHSQGWQMRYVPFLWVLPFVLLLPTPEKRAYLLWAPLSLALINTFGVFYFYISHKWVMSQTLMRNCAPYAGETVLLDRTVLEWNGIFDRYGITQKFANPEETVFHRGAVDLGFLAGPRSAEGVNLSFAEDLPPVPETPVAVDQESALSWLKMSEGLMPVEVSDPFSRVDRIEWRTYANKVKFYMFLDKRPEGDWEISLDGTAFDEGRSVKRELSVLVFINNEQIGTWNIGDVSQTKTFTIPRRLMEESFRDTMRLVTLMLRFPGVPSLLENYLEASRYGLRLNGMQLHPLATEVEIPLE
ncbi:MAG: hypothetical protein LBJ22_07185, partial [Synergistaceae bacterium]|jgi:hypothetical protein|nr:hypothetical protein [Synergistaceae bacterium]